MSDQGLRTYFEGSEVADELANDASAAFFVDLRVDTRYTFDQEDEPIDFAYFTVQCPSMARPMPMPDFAALLGIEVEQGYWTLESAEASFRNAATDCVIQCDKQGFCHLVCPEPILP